MNNLQALENLKQSAKQQSKELESTITEIHKQNSKDLLESLKATHEKRSKNLEQSIQSLAEQMKENFIDLNKEIVKIHKNKLDTIEEMIESKLEKENNLKAILTGVVTFILTIAIISGIVYFTINKQYQPENQRTAYFYIIEHNKGK